MMRFDPDRQRAMQAASLTREQVLADDPAGFFDGALTAPFKGAAAGAAQTGGLFYGAASGAVNLYNHVLQWQDELAQLAGLPASRKVDTDWLDAQRDNALNVAQQYKPDPASTGLAGQVLFDLSRIMTQVGAGAGAAAASGGAGVAALTTGAATTGAATTYGKFDELKKAGIDDTTALTVAAIEGITTGAGVVVPASIGYKTLAGAGLAKGAKTYLGANVAYGAGANIGMGVAQRALSHDILKQNGYAHMAAHYEPLEASALMAEGALGAIFGAVGAKAGLAYRASAIRDAALAATDARHAALQTAPGIPADPATAAAHSRALNEAIEHLLGGQEVNVAGSGVTDGQFVARPRTEAAGIDAAEVNVAESRIRELLAIDESPLVLQNRNRASAASIAQMNAIAANPDYLRTGVSRSMGEGAPVVFGNADVLPDTALMGRAETVTDGTGQRVDTRYAVVEGSDILTSNLADGSPVAEYTEGQTGRLRTAAGNGRAAGLNAAYERGTAGRYRAELLLDAANLGMDATAIDLLRRPVLVRVMNQSDVRPDIGDASNITASAVLSPVEQASNDARRVQLSALQFDEHGQPTPASVRAFVAAMPEAERGALMNPDGSPTRQAVERIMAAAFRQAYGHEELVRLFAQALDSESRTVMAALANVAGRMASLAGAGEFDLRALVAQAGVMAVNARRAGVKLSDLVKQIDLDTDPQVLAIAEFFARHIRSTRKITEGLRQLAEAAQAQIDIIAKNAAQTGMFGEQPTLSREQVLQTLNGIEPEMAGLTAQARTELMQRFATAGRIKPAFDATLERIANDTGAALIPAPIKGAARAATKIANDYNGNAARIKDLVRATLVVDDNAQLQAVLQHIERLGWRIKRDNLSADGASSPTGYRDALVEVDFEGFPAELQISTPEMMAAKAKAHPLYVQETEIRRKATAKNRDLTAQEEIQVAELIRQQREIYEPAWEATKARNSASLSNDPLRQNESYGNGRPPGTSQATVRPLTVSDTGISSTSANRVPSGNDSGNSITGITEPPDGIIPLAARAQDDLETRAGLALLEQHPDLAQTVELAQGLIMDMHQADAEAHVILPDTLSAAVQCGLSRR